MTADIVFDLDGVLVDTERLKFRAHREAVEAAGGRLDRDDYRRGMGRPHDEVIRLFLSAAGLPDDPVAAGAYEDRFRAAYRRRLEEELAPAEGADELLAACGRQGRRLALVTSSDPWMVEIVLGRLGWEGRFGAVVTAADVEAEKPDPEPYRRASAALEAVDAGSGTGNRDTGPAGAVAVEDTEAGVASAAGAGLPVMAVRHAFNGRHDFGRAAAVVDGLAPADAFLARADRLAAGGSRPAGGG